jgi:salicylate hydroxylase
LRQAELPAPLRQTGVTAWLGPRHHVVHYPVRGGDWLNLVAVVHGRVNGDAQDWSHHASAAALRAALGEVHRDLQAVLDAVPGWTLWPLHDRPPVRGANELAQGRVALLGDAAHPMRPYLAQGAAMALEDAWALGRVLGQGWRERVPALLQGWARERWPRNAWVQARSRRNGRIFHLQGPMRWARDVAMAVGAEQVMDVPALYAGP